jgi:hypothetical protein
VRLEAWWERDEKLTCDDDTESHSMRSGELEVRAEGERRLDLAAEASAEGDTVRIMATDGLQPKGEEMV